MNNIRPKDLCPKAPYCKDSYIGAPVKAIAHPCEYCGKSPCCCKGNHPFKGCGCGHGGKGICAVVVDDATDKVYLYGDIMHENYHVPGANCVAYVGVKSAGFESSGRQYASEFFEGVQDNNNCLLSHKPIVDDRFQVFLNGLKQRQGAENDYIVKMIIKYTSTSMTSPMSMLLK